MNYLLDRLYLKSRKAMVTPSNETSELDNKPEIPVAGRSCSGSMLGSGAGTITPEAQSESEAH